MPYTVAATPGSGQPLSDQHRAIHIALKSAVDDLNAQTVFSAKAYGATGDGTTDDTSALQDAIDGCAVGGTVNLGPGTYRTSSPLVLARNVTLQGTHAPRWQYRGGSPCVIRPTAGFSGAAVLHIPDKSISGNASDNDGGRIRALAVDSSAMSAGETGVPSILFEGLVRDWAVEDVDVSYCRGHGIRTTQGGGTGNPRGFYLRRVSSYAAKKSGFYFETLTDSLLDDLLAVQSTERGITLYGGGELKLANSRAVFCGSSGLVLEGSQTVGGIQVDNFSTDRNNNNGVYVTLKGTQPIVFTNLLTRRDGKNSNSGGGGYSGFAAVGSSGNEVAPLLVLGIVQTTGKDDDGSGTTSPENGVLYSYTTYLRMEGFLAGATRATQDNGNHLNTPSLPTYFNRTGAF